MHECSAPRKEQRQRTHSSREVRANADERLCKAVALDKSQPSLIVEAGTPMAPDLEDFNRTRLNPVRLPRSNADSPGNQAGSAVREVDRDTHGPLVNDTHVHACGCEGVRAHEARRPSTDNQHIDFALYQRVESRHGRGSGVEQRREKEERGESHKFDRRRRSLLYQLGSALDCALR